MNRKIFIVIYNCIHDYPPTLNAIEILQPYFDKTVVIDLDNSIKDKDQELGSVTHYKIKYKGNSFIKRILSYVRFTRKIRLLIRVEKPDIILFYDAVAALSVYMATRFLKHKPIFWYHVHDSADKKYIVKNSLNALAMTLERKMIRELSFFSLPSAERKAAFNLAEFKGDYFFIPNYPLKIFYSNINNSAPEEKITIVYQGMICANRGIEEVLSILPLSINHLPVNLHLIGHIDAAYKMQLDDLIQKRKISQCVMFIGIIHPKILPVETSKAHIGMAIYTAVDNMYSTMATASNKTYEYAACGLPFLYYDNNHFASHLSRMPWAVPTSLSQASLISGISHIINNYKELSHLAKQDFLNVRNYESVFLPAVEKVINTLAKEEGN